MDLEVGFDDKVVKTPICIKMDAHDQLILLSKGVCSQLGIVEYHDNVWQGRELGTNSVLETGNVSGEATVPIVRTFQVRLLESVTVPANKAVTVPVYISKDKPPVNTLMLFEGYDYVPEVTTLCSLMDSDNARIEIFNDRGFTGRSQETL